MLSFLNPKPCFCIGKKFCNMQKVNDLIFQASSALFCKKQCVDIYSCLFLIVTLSDLEKVSGCCENLLQGSPVHLSCQ